MNKMKKWCLYVFLESCNSIHMASQGQKDEIMCRLLALTLETGVEVTVSKLSY